MVRVEGQYALIVKEYGKEVIPLKMEAGYDGDDWLGLFCKTNLYYDFSDPEKFEDQWSKLHDRLKSLKIAKNVTSRDVV